MFSDLKIIELSSVLAGPMVARFFSEQGAHVLKVENKNTGGDVTRKWKLASEPQNEISAYYAAANYNKDVVMLDLKDLKDYEFVLEQIKTADIVIVNFKQGDAEKFKLDYTALKKINSQLIYGSITGYGTESSRTAFDVVLQAETGYMYMNGAPNTEPVKMPVALIDLLAAHQLKEALLCALIKKMKTGKGSHVTVSLFDTAISSLANQATNWLMAKHIPQAMGSQHPNIAPYGDLFLSKDKKYIVLAIGSDRQFEHLCFLLGKQKLSKDLRYTENKARVKNRQALYQDLKDCFKTKNATYWSNLFEKAQIPAGIVKNLKEVFENKKAQELILTEHKAQTYMQSVQTVVYRFLD